MGAEVRCPHCATPFFAGGSPSEAACPSCGKAVPPPGAPSAPASPVPARMALKRACPSCGGSYPGELNRCPKCGANARMARLAEAEAKEEDGIVPVNAGIRAGIGAGVLGGIVLILLAVVWFVLGWMAGRIFIYPAFLAVAGIYAVIKGLVTGNLAGEKGTAPRRTRRR